MSSTNIYYVYAYLRSKDSETAKAGTPYYIGKGKGRRAYIPHIRNGKSITPLDKNDIVILEHHLSETIAYNIEEWLIAYHGRVDLCTGILRNLTDGGKLFYLTEDSMKLNVLKTKQTIQTRYNGDNHFHIGSDDHKGRMITKYGVDNPSKNAEILARKLTSMKATNKIRHFADYPFQNSEIHNKAIMTIKKNGSLAKENNPSARKICISSPTNELFFSHGNLNSLLSQLNMSHGTSVRSFQRMLYDNFIPTYGKNFGWSISYQD